MKSRTRILLIGSIGILACVLAWYVHVASVELARMDDIRELVFRKIIPKDGTAYMSVGYINNDATTTTRFLNFFRKQPRFQEIVFIDPRDTFLERLHDLKIDFKRASQTKRNGDDVVDKQTGKHATIYFVENFKHVSNLEYEVYAGTHCGTHCGESDSYLVGYENGGWHIKSKYNHFDSIH